MKESKSHIKLSQMAQRLSRSIKQFRADVKKHRIPHLLLGRTKLFCPEEVEKHLAQQALLDLLSQNNNSPKSINKQAKRKPLPTIQTEKKDQYKQLLGLS